MSFSDKTPHRTGVFQNTLLDSAVVMQDARLLEKLLTTGNKQYSHERAASAALLRAAHLGKTEIAKILIKHGASVGWQHMCGQRNFSLLLAAHGGHTQMVELLLENGADVNQTNALGHTALFMAAKGGYLSIIHILLRFGADARLCDRRGRTPLYFAIVAHHFGIAEFLRHIATTGRYCGDLLEDTLCDDSVSGTERPDVASCA